MQQDFFPKNEIKTELLNKQQIGKQNKDDSRVSEGFVINEFQEIGFLVATAPEQTTEDFIFKKEHWNFWIGMQVKGSRPHNKAGGKDKKIIYKNKLDIRFRHGSKGNSKLYDPFMIPYFAIVIIEEQKRLLMIKNTGQKSFDKCAEEYTEEKCKLSMKEFIREIEDFYKKKLS